MIGGSERKSGAAAQAVGPGPTAGKFRIPYWLVAIGLGVPIALIVLAASPLGADFIFVMLGIPALLLAWLLAGICAAILSVGAAMRRAWRQCLVLLVLPLVMLFFGMDPNRLARACNHLGNLLHFALAKPSYDRQIASMPADRKPLLLNWDWGGMVWCSTGIVYDETDQVSLPEGRQSVDWLERASHTELSCEGYAVQPLWDHYYLASFPC